MDGDFSGWQGKKHRNTLCIPSIFDAVQAEKGSHRWYPNVVNAGSYILGMSWALWIEGWDCIRATAAAGISSSASMMV